MALSDVAANLTEPDALPWRTCGVCHYVDSLTAEDRATFEELLRNRGVKYSQIRDAFRADPDLPNLEYDAIRRHGNGDGGHTVRFR